MELIIGGAYQGKLTYAVKKHGFTEEELCDLADGLPARERSCFYHLEALTKAACRRDLSSVELVKELMPYIKNGVIISREVGCGIVPMDPEERLYREMHGEVLRALAGEAEAVIRVFCGIPEVLK